MEVSLLEYRDESPEDRLGSAASPAKPAAPNAGNAAPPQVKVRLLRLSYICCALLLKQGVQGLKGWLNQPTSLLCLPPSLLQCPRRSSPPALHASE
eukprot:2338118-Pyramimonas_sp.AAC.1